LFNIESCCTGGPVQPGQCSASQFMCEEGTCIEAILRCDQRFDCPDGSDEFDCSTAVFFVILYTRILYKLSMERKRDKLRIKTDNKMCVDKETSKYITQHL